MSLAATAASSGVPHRTETTPRLRPKEELRELAEAGTRELGDDA